MGDSKNNKGEGADDLLSQLFDLDEGLNAGQEFTAPTKVEETVVVKAADSSSSETSVDGLFHDDAPSTAPLGGSLSETQTPPFEEDAARTQPMEAFSEREATQMLEMPVLDESPDDTDKTQSFEPAAGSPEDIAEQLIDDVLSSDEAKSDKIRITKTSVEPPQSSQPSDNEPELELMDVDDDGPADEPKASAARETKSAHQAQPNDEADPIDLALSNFEKAREGSNPGAQTFLPDGAIAEEVSAADFQAEKSQKAHGGKKKLDLSMLASMGPLSRRSKKVFVITMSSIGILLVLGVSLTKLWSEEGLFGFRVVGLDVVRAYTPPTAETMNEIQKVLQGAELARLEDSAEQLPEWVQKVSNLLTIDERNEEAAVMGLEISGRLIYWYGVGSQWPADFEKFNERLVVIQQKKGALQRQSVISRAKVWRAMAVEDLPTALAELRGTTSSSDATENMFLARYIEWKLKGVVAESKQVAPKGRLYEFLLAHMSGDRQEISRLAKKAYLPAEVEMFKFEKPTKKKIVDAETLLKRVEKYPALRLHVLDSVADAHSALGDSRQARELWKEVLKLGPRLGRVWLKVAESFQDEATWDEALNAYQAAQKGNVLTEAGYAKYISLLRIRNRVVDALQAFEEGIKIYTDSALLHLEKGLVQAAIFQEEQAKQSFLKALELKPNLEAAQFGLVQLALYRRDWIEAETLLKNISESSPKYAESLVSLAQIAVEQNRYKDAETTYRRAIEMNPKLERSYVDLVDLYLTDERDDKAMELVERGMEQIPKSPLLQIAKAKVLEFRGDVSGALDTVEGVRRIHDHLPEVNFAYAKLLIQRKEIRKAFETLDLFKTQQAHLPEVGYLKVRAFLTEPENPLGLGSSEMASKVIDDVLRKKPDDLRYRLAAAEVALSLQDKKGAVQHIDLMMKARPDYAPALVIRADFFRDDGDCKSAITLYEDASRQTRNKSPIYKKMAQCYRSEGKTALAIDYFQKVTQADSKDVESFLELGRLLSEEGRYSASMKALNNVIRLNPKVPEAHYLLGFVHKELGNRKDAVISFNRFLEISPNAMEAATVRDEVFFLKGGLSNP